MASSFTAERFERSAAGDVLFATTVILLVGGGLSVLFSSSIFRAENLFGDGLHFIRNQLPWTALGAGLAMLISRLNLDRIMRFLPVFVIGTVVLMVLPFVPGLSAPIHGARRWIFLFGFSFQPSELAKAVLILYLAYILSRKQNELDDPVNALLPPFLVVVAFAGLTYLQNDFSTATYLMGLGMIMFFVAGAPIRYFLGLGTLTLPLLVILVLSRAHRVNRLLAYLEPQLDPSGAGFQIMASHRAVGSGGLFGTGIGLGMHKRGALPEAHSDFVFAVLAEETGLIGVTVVLALFAAFGWRGYHIAWHAGDSFRCFLAFGLTTSILFQALINVSVVAGIVPATGIPLPFFSSGGSSVLVSLLMCGLIANVARRPDGEAQAGVNRGGSYG